MGNDLQKTTNTNSIIDIIPKKNTVIKSILSKVKEISQGTKKDSHSFPNHSQDLLAWVLEDSLLRSCVEITHSTIMKAGYKFTGKDTKTNLDKLKKLRFDNWLSTIWWQLIVYKNGFTELAQDSTTETKSLHVIKTDEVEIVNTDTGVVKGYLQIPSNPQSASPQIINLPKDRVVHIAFNRLSTSLWGQSNIPTITRTLYAKRLVESYINWLFESNQFRSVIKIPTGVVEEDINSYLEMIKQGMLNPTNFLVVQGDQADWSVLRKIEGFDQLLKIIDNYRSEVLALMQMPPIQMGILESSNRSSSEYQVRYAFYNYIYSLLKQMEDELNNEFFPALNMKGLEIHFNLLDDKAKNDLLDMGQKLTQMGANPKKLNQWLIDKGLDIPDDLLEEMKEEMPQGNQTKSLDKNSNIHPSRKPSKMDFASGLDSK